MKGKLIKVDDVYRLIVDRLISGTTDSEYQKAFSDYCFMLSSNNCETIASGYDLDELAYEKSWNEDSEKGFINGAKAILEILGDKKFSKDDMKKAFEKGALKLGNNRYFDELIESLNKNEWEVEILMEKMNLDEIREQGKGFLNASTEKPKLDENGCLILKSVE